MDINVNGTIYSSAYSAFYMAKNQPDERGERGVIIQIASSLGTQGPKGFVSYSASKGAITIFHFIKNKTYWNLLNNYLNIFKKHNFWNYFILGLTLPMARDLGKYGIRVFNIAPSLIKTPMGESLGEELFKAAASTGPLNRVGELDEFSHLVIHNILICLICT